MANKIKLARGTKARIELIKDNIQEYEIVLSTDTKEIGVKLEDDIAWFPNIEELNKKVSITTFDNQLLEKLNIRPNGTDLLIVGGKVNAVYIDSSQQGSSHPIVDSEAEMLALNVDVGTVVIRSDKNNELYILKATPASELSNWAIVSPNTVVSVAGKTGIVLLGISDIDGLTQALNLKVNATTFESEITRLAGLIDNKVDKVAGKGLSTNDFTTVLKNKLDGINDADIVKINDISQVYGGKNLAVPDLEGKEYLGEGEYELSNGIIYDIYNGEYLLNGNNIPEYAEIFKVGSGTYTIKGTLSADLTTTLTRIIINTYINGVFNNSLYYGDILNGFTITGNNIEFYLILSFASNESYNNSKIKLQIEQGSTATPYTLPLWITPEYLEKTPMTTTLGNVSNDNSLEVNKNNFYNSSHTNLTFVIGGTFNAFTFSIPISEYESKFTTGDFAFVGVFNPDTPAYYIIQVRPNITGDKVRISRLGTGSDTLPVKVIAT